jgi:thiaminase/transcriptional activator TenA
MYSSPEFGELAEWLRSFIDRIALGLSDRQRERLAEIFVANSKYEYLFWDAAYRMEEWPV